MAIHPLVLKAIESNEQAHAAALRDGKINGQGRTILQAELSKTKLLLEGHNINLQLARLAKNEEYATSLQKKVEQHEQTIRIFEDALRNQVRVKARIKGKKKR